MYVCTASRVRHFCAVVCGRDDWKVGNGCRKPGGRCGGDSSGGGGHIDVGKA